MEQIENFGSAPVAGVPPGVACASRAFEVENVTRSAQSGGGSEPQGAVKLVNFVGFARWLMRTIISAFRGEFERRQPCRKRMREAERHADAWRRLRPAQRLTLASLPRSVLQGLWHSRDLLSR